MSTTRVGAGQESSLAFYRPFLPLFGTIFCCLLSVGASLATLPFPPCCQGLIAPRQGELR